MADTNDITILIAGKLHEHAVRRLSAAFNAIPVDGADISSLGERERAAVRGVAASAVSGDGIGPAFIDALPNLEVVASFGVGYDHVDARYAGGKGVVVTNTPDVLTDEVADTAVGLLINTVRELPRAEEWLRQGKWKGVGNYPLTHGTLRGRKVGIFGMGRIGQAIARRLAAFGLPISYHNRRPVADVNYTYYSTLVELAGAVDTLVSVVPGGPETEKAVDTEVLAALGPEGVFVNIGRGSTVDEAALARALTDGTIMAAGLDVFADEPNVPQGLLDAPNACLLPHVGSATVHTRQAMADLVVDNLLAWFNDGRPLTPTPETRHITAKTR